MGKEVEWLTCLILYFLNALTFMEKIHQYSETMCNMMMNYNLNYNYGELDDKMMPNDKKTYLPYLLAKTEAIILLSYGQFVTFLQSKLFKE